jgi:hypothetical protein
MGVDKVTGEDYARAMTENVSTDRMVWIRVRVGAKYSRRYVWRQVPMPDSLARRYPTVQEIAS